jgi:hypothetical protein
MHISFAFLKGIIQSKFKQEDFFEGNGTGQDFLFREATYSTFVEYEVKNSYSDLWGDGLDEGYGFDDFCNAPFDDETLYGNGRGDGMVPLNTICLEGNDA